MTPWLKQSQIDDLCDPLTQAAAQVRYLRSLGLTVRLKPNRRAVVLRSNCEAVLGYVPGEEAATEPPRASAPPSQPDAVGLVLAFQHRK